MRRQSTEERELEKKRAELADLEARLTERELELATLQAKLHVFERCYLQVVGARYVELDELRARLAEQYARCNRSVGLDTEESNTLQHNEQLQESTERFVHEKL